MKSTVVMSLVSCLYWINVCSAVDLTFLQPDGRPAAGTKFYQTYRESGRGSGGMGMEMDMMMDEGMGGYGEMGMGGMDGGYGGGEEMMMGMGMGEMQDQRPHSAEIAFLNGAPLQPMTGQIGGEFSSGDDGKIQLGKEMLRRSRGVSTHFRSALAVHESGISFVPSGTKFSPKIVLRSGGKIIVAPPEGIDTSQFQVLTCWQNGFAYPSLSHFIQQLGPSKKPGKQIDQNDWRFKPRFRWFQSARLGEMISVPPGEIRVTIVPMRPRESTLASMNADQLFDLLTTGGPSTLALVSGQSFKPTTVDFGTLRSLICRIPQQNDDTLPDWGDESQSQFRLERFHRTSIGDTPTLRDPSSREFSSRIVFAGFLNKNRSERALYQPTLIPSSTDTTSVRFDLLRPGWYVVNQLNDDGSKTLGIPVIDWDHSSVVSTAVLADGKIKGVDGAFELAVSDQGVITFNSDRSVEQVAKQAINSKRRTDAEKLKLVQTLRREIETTMSRMIEHRKRLLKLEATLLKAGSNDVPTTDPFGGDPNTDPFGGGPSADPFGGDELQPADPFGGEESGEPDPFG